MKLLFVTIKLHAQHAFVALWARAFAARGYEVELVVLEDRRDLAAAVLGEDSALPFAVHSLGKDRGYGKPRQALRYCEVIARVRPDRAFIHGVPVWGLLGSWYFAPMRVPTYLWYTHYTTGPSLRVTARYARRLFCATDQSLPQYARSPKKIVTGHGIDLAYWPKRPNTCERATRLLCVHRLSRSKRVELLLRGLALLPHDYTLDIYGEVTDPPYVAELEALVDELGLRARVAFHGSAPVRALPEIYARHRLILNMASETIDKTMLEAMTCGCYPVVTARNAAAIGLPAGPDDEPAAIAEFVAQRAEGAPLTADEMYRIVAERHSLDRLIERLDSYIRPGI